MKKEHLMIFPYLIIQVTTNSLFIIIKNINYVYRHFGLQVRGPNLATSKQALGASISHLWLRL